MRVDALLVLIGPILVTLALALAGARKMGSGRLDKSSARDSLIFFGLSLAMAFLTFFMYQGILSL